MAMFQMLAPTYWLLVGPTILLAIWAQYRVKSAYATYSRIGTRRSRSFGHRSRVDVAHGFLGGHFDVVGLGLFLGAFALPTSGQGQCSGGNESGGQKLFHRTTFRNSHDSGILPQVKAQPRPVRRCLPRAESAMRKIRAITG